MVAYCATIIAAIRKSGNASFEDSPRRSDPNPQGTSQRTGAREREGFLRDREESSRASCLRGKFLKLPAALGSGFSTSAGTTPRP
jgi:hypothetical protein